MNRWNFFVESKPWEMRRSLHILHAGSLPGAPKVWPEPDAAAAMHTPTFTSVTPLGGSEQPPPFLTGHLGPAGDEVGEFLQAALDAAWELGLRPTGYADHKNELAAVRHHLDDMRALVGVTKKRGQ